MSDAHELHHRRPRFAREGRDIIRITADDSAVIGHVGRYRFLSSVQLLRLFPERSRQNLLRRFSSLFHAGYLDRPDVQINHFAFSGSAPIIYALGNKGAELYAQLQHTASPLIDWTDKNRSLTRPYIEHTLLIADVMIGLETTLLSRADLAVLRDAALRPLLPTTRWRLSNPWSLSARIAQDGKHQTISVAPDAVFAIQFLTFDRRSHFFLEADRATMPIERSSLSQSSFKRKLQVYLAAHRANEHQLKFGFRNLRVLTVTTSMERIQSMLQVVKAITDGNGHGMFLFTDAATLAKYSDPLTLPWITTAGPVRIDVPPR